MNRHQAVLNTGQSTTPAQIIRLLRQPRRRATHSYTLVSSPGRFPEHIEIPVRSTKDSSIAARNVKQTLLHSLSWSDRNAMDDRAACFPHDRHTRRPWRNAPVGHCLQLITNGWAMNAMAYQVQPADRWAITRTSAPCSKPEPGRSSENGFKIKSNSNFRTPNQVAQRNLTEQTGNANSDNRTHQPTGSVLAKHSHSRWRMGASTAYGSISNTNMRCCPGS